MTDIPRLAAHWNLSLTALLLLLSAVHAEDRRGAALQRISLPRGPGSVEGLGESVVPDLVSGAARYAVQIAVPPAANEHVPKLTLSYDSGSAIGPFGIGWSLSNEFVQRQTDKGIPDYSDDDVPIFGNEELVRLVDGSYFAENGADFSRFLKIGDGWRQLQQTGTVVEYGKAHQAREVRPPEHRRSGGGFADTFKWLKSSSTDVHGNRIEYDYVEFPDSVGTKLPFGIRYGFKTWPAQNYHEIRFEYEQSRAVVTSFCSSFERCLSRRCSAVTVSTVVGGFSKIVRKYVLTYAPGRTPLLESITQTDGAGNGLPPLRFTYGSAKLNTAAQPATANLSLRRGLSTNDIALCDLNRDGLPDFCVSVPGRHWEYLLNQGGLKFEGPRTLDEVSPAISLRDPVTQLMDITGDGVVDLLTASSSDQDVQPVAYFEFGLANDPSSPFRRPKVDKKKVFANLCSTELFGAGVRVFDVDFDKSIDVTRILDDSLIVALNRDAGDLGRRWDERRVFYSESHFPFGTLSPSMQLADLNGDRVMDCVDVFDRDGLVKVTMYPGHGDGRFGTGRQFVFAGATGESDTGEHLTSNLQSFHFGDVNSDGLSDLLHVAPGNVRVWTSWGRGFEPPQDFAAPIYHTSTQVLLADMNANGSTDLVWLDPAANEQVQVLECFPQGRGNLLTSISNGIGKVTLIRYRSLNDYYLAHITGNSPWPSGCPLPTHVVAEISASNSLDLDLNGEPDTERTTFVYEHPYYDGFERQFRGFAFVTEICWGTDDDSPGGTATRVRRLHFHTGADDGLDNDGNKKADQADFNPVAGREEEPLKGKLLWEETCALSAVAMNSDGTLAALRDHGTGDGADNDGDGQVDEADEAYFCADKHVYRRQLNEWSVRRLFSNDSAPALFPHKTADKLRLVRDAVRLAEHVLHVEGPNVHSLPVNERATWTPRHVKKTFVFDELGRPTKTIEYGIVSPPAQRDEPRERITEYAGGRVAPDNWILDRVALSVTCGADGKAVFGERHYYGDVYDSFQHLPFGSIGAKSLRIKTERLFVVDSQQGFDRAKLEGADWLRGAVRKYDEFGNLGTILDGLGNPADHAAGHSRSIEYDPYFHVFPVSETIHVAPQMTLRADASYDLGLGVLTSCTDFELTEAVDVRDTVARTPIGMPRSVSGNLTLWKYDSHGRLTSLVRPGDSEAFPTEIYRYVAADPVADRKYVYDSGGIVTVTNASGIWKLELGTGNGEFETQVGLSAVITEKRESAGQAGTIASAKLTDGFNRTLSIVSESDDPGILLSERTSFDNRGNPQFIAQPYSDLAWNVQTMVSGDRARRDPLGRVISIRHPPDDKAIVAFTRSLFLPSVERVYDEEGTLADGEHEGTFKDLQKDGFERLTAVHQNVKLNDDGTPSPVRNTWTTSYRYDLSDNLVLIRDAQDNVSYHDYDSLNRRRRIREPDRGTSLFEYDAADNLVKTQDARGGTIICTYDGANRKITEIGSFGSFNDVVCYNFDLSADGVVDENGAPFASARCRGRLAWVKDASGAEYFSYDARGQAVRVLKQIGEKIYERVEEFDSQQRLTRQEIAGRGTKRRYGRRGLIASLTDRAGDELIAYSHHPNGIIHQETADNGVVTQRLLDHRLRNASLSIRGPQPGDFMALKYSYDAASNLVCLQDLRTLAQLPAGDVRRDTILMKYDDARRLCEETYNLGLPDDLIKLTTKYDRVGNVLERAAPLNRTGTPNLELGLGVRLYGARFGRDGAGVAAPGPHAMTATTSGACVQYAADGSMISLNCVKLERDAWGRIRRVLAEGAVKSESLYDHEGKRVRLRMASSERYSPFLQLDENPDGTIDYYATERDRRLIGFHASGKRFYHHNHMNSTVVITSATGALEEEIAYYCSGMIRNRWSAGGTPSRYTYCNKEFDSTVRLYDFGARHLAADLGCFSSCDPVLPNAKSKFLVDPLSLNPYIYAAHNSHRHIDPDGKVPVETVVDIGFIVFDIGKLAYGYCTNNAATVSEAKFDLAVDMFAALVPYMVAGVSRIGRGAMHATEDVVGASTKSFVDQMSPSEAARYKGYWEQQYHQAGHGTRYRDQVAPGIRSITDQKLSRTTGEVYERQSIYDPFGRRIGNNEFTTHGRSDHVNPHHHTRDPIKGQLSEAKPGLHPQTPDGPNP